MKAVVPHPDIYPGTFQLNDVVTSIPYVVLVNVTVFPLATPVYITYPGVAGEIGGTIDTVTSTAGCPSPHAVPAYYQIATTIEQRHPHVALVTRHHITPPSNIARTFSRAYLYNSLVEKAVFNTVEITGNLDSIPRYIKPDCGSPLNRTHPDYSVVVASNGEYPPAGKDGITITVGHPSDVILFQAITVDIIARTVGAAMNVDSGPRLGKLRCSGQCC